MSQHTSRIETWSLILTLESIVTDTEDSAAIQMQQTITLNEQYNYAMKKRNTNHTNVVDLKHEIIKLQTTSNKPNMLSWLEIAFRYYLISSWNIGPSQFTEILCIIQIPFTTRILYGLLIDTVSFFGYKRKSYLFLFGMIAILSSLYYTNSFIIQILCLCVRSFSIAFCDVIIQAITVERSEYKPHTVAIRLQSLNYFSMYVISSIGLIIAAKFEEIQKPKILFMFKFRGLDGGNVAPTSNPTAYPLTAPFHASPTPCNCITNASYRSPMTDGINTDK